tara:strand:+ start:4304 stop:7462 length:3159 start_codon:yes stop_codon:yes gene_type:complete
LSYKVAHISDTHIRLLKFHKEYRIVFEQIYSLLKKGKVDYIVHCGDLFHNKTNLSPEAVKLSSEFLKGLADIAPTMVIAGNHDGNLKNSSRQDAITPIVDALEHQNLFYFKGSGEFHVNDDLCFNVLSVFDEDNWVKPTSPKKINIALYHGSINNCLTDTGWKMEIGEHDLSIFDGHDYALLGDIHKCQTLDVDGRVRYAGSTIQQNHGESNDKGFLIWDIEDKDNFEVRHVELKNPKPFVTLELTKKGRIPKHSNVPKDARLRLVSNNNLPLDTLRRAVEIAKSRFKPESVTFLNRATGKNGQLQTNNDIIKENLRDLAVQERLIKEFLKDFHADDEVLEKVLDLNKKYNAVVEQGEEVARNINWELISLEWDNLFNYGKGNKINFKNLSGIVGIFGKNFSGKSSIIDGLLVTLYNSISKNARKNLNIINQNKQSAKSKAVLRIGDSDYTIERSIEKYIKKLKGVETTEARTDIEFSSHDSVADVTVGRNGLTRTDTDKNIRKRFGVLEDFLLTSMASQNGALAFINEGSTRRKEILAKFLDLEFFEQKFRLAKDDAADVKGALKRLEDRNFDEEILEAEKLLALNLNQINELEIVYEKQKSLLNELRETLVTLSAQVSNVPEEIFNIHDLRTEQEGKKEKRNTLKEDNRELRKQRTKKKNLLKKIELFLGKQFDIDEWEKKRLLIKEKNLDLSVRHVEISSEERRSQGYGEKIKLLEEVPCGEEYSHCKFIKGAYEAKEQFDVVRVAMEKMNASRLELCEEIEKLNSEKVEEYLNKHNQIVERQRSLNSEIVQLNLIIDKNNATRESLFLQIRDLDKKIRRYEKNKDVVENLEKLYNEKEELEVRLGEEKILLEEYDKNILELYKQNGSHENRIQTLNEQKDELQSLRDEYEAHDLFQRCMHPNGISYDVIKKKLPVINDEIAKVLANIVDFEVFFENEDRRLNIFIKHPKFDPRPIEMGSGAEKMIASTGIRLALLSISSLPKGDLIILDEPATELDESNMEGFIRILDLMKSYYKTVLLISHLDTLKDCADVQIMIDKDGEGYAHVDC